MPQQSLPPDSQDEDLDEADILEAMREMPDYLDISASDFRALYRLAQRQAIKRLFSASPQPVATHPALSELWWSWIGAFLGIGTLIVLNQYVFSDTDLTLVIGSLGASAVLLYGAPRSPLAQPRNLIGGHLFSALIGVSCWQWLGSEPALAAAVAVATAIVIMQLTRTLHPPGGATALIAVIGSPEIHALGYGFVLAPALLGPLLLLVIALGVNNLARTRRYPTSWW